MTRPGLRRDALVELQRAEGLFEPIIAENWVVTQASDAPGIVTNWAEILRWEAPDAMFGIIDSFAVFASHPQAYQQCRFEVAKNGTRVNNIQFTQPSLGTERQGSAGLRFGENEVISVRYVRDSDMSSLGVGWLPILLVARLTGRYTHERVA